MAASEHVGPFPRRAAAAPSTPAIGVRNPTARRTALETATDPMEIDVHGPSKEERLCRTRKKLAARRNSNKAAPVRPAGKEEKRRCTDAYVRHSANDGVPRSRYL